MADSEVKVVISGDSSTAQSAMASASQAVKDGVAQMKDSLSGLTDAFKGLSESFLAIGEIFAGGAAFKEIIDQTKEWASEAINLGRSLGVAASAASVYMVAIEAVGGSSDDFASASRGLTRQLKTNEKALNDMGIVTRNAKGDLLDFNTLMFEAIEVVNSYAEGTDRNLAAQTAFGRGANVNSAILRLTSEGLKEAANDADVLNLTVGPQSVAAFTANRAATAAAMDTLKGLGNTIGNALLPILTQLEQWFRAIGPAAIIVLRGALGLLLTPIWGLITGFNILLDVAQGVFNTLATIFTGLATAVNDALHGNMAKAEQDLKGIGAGIQKNWKDAWTNIVADSTKAHDQIVALFSDPDTAPAPGGGGKKFNLAEKGEKGPDNRLAQYKNERTEEAQAAGDFDQKDIAADQAFWAAKLALVTGSTKEDVKLREQINKIILDDNKKLHDQDLKAQEEYIKTSEAFDLGEIAVKQQQLAQDLAMGKITQQQELAGLVALENQKYAIEKKALDDKLALLDYDRLAQQKVLDQELLLEQKHAADVKKINDKAALEENKTWSQLFSSMRSGFASTITSFLNGTASLGSTIKGLFQDIGNSIIQMIANMAAQWLETSLMQILMSKTSAAAIITTLAAQAAAGAFAATAAIPYVGPELAPAAAALAYADTMSFQAAASAAGGFDIPAGMNPVTQLHQKEMVLPAHIAQPLRNMLKGGGGGGQTVNISAADARSLAKALAQGGGSSPLAKGIRRLNKGFVGR
jgi:hypothetical protein